MTDIITRSNSGYSNDVEKDLKTTTTAVETISYRSDVPDVPQNAVLSANPIIRPLEKAQHFLGFNKFYNFPLWVIFGGVMIGFVLARLPYYAYGYGHSHLGGRQNWYWYSQSLYHYGIFLHLGGVLPSGFLAVFQFIPIIRKKWLIAHRIIGYIAIFLQFIGIAGAIIISRRTWGGDVATQAAVFFLASGVTGAFGMAWYNIKVLQIDEHRKWMLRAWFYTASVISLRIMFSWITLMFMSIGSYYTHFTCDELSYILNDAAVYAADYPQCQGLADPRTLSVLVQASKHVAGDLMGYESALRLGFAMATWCGAACHILGVEMYIHLTQGESERLRRISYHKQLERGFRNPGSAGLTANVWGDAEWNPPTKSQAVSRV